MRKLLAFVSTAEQELDNALLGKKACSERLFLMDASSKYRDITAAMDVAKSWKETLALVAPPSTLALVGVEPLVVAFVRDSFSLEEHSVWSLPLDDFDAIRTDDGRIAPELHSPPLRDIATFFEVIDGVAGSEADSSHTGVFFTVRLARPEKLKIAGGAHLKVVNSNSSVEILSFVGGDGVLEPSGVNVMGGPTPHHITSDSK